MMIVLPTYEIHVEQDYAEDLILKATQGDIETLIKVFMNNGFTKFTVEPERKPIQVSFTGPVPSPLGIAGMV